MTVDDSSQDPFSVHCLVAPGTSGAGFVLVLPSPPGRTLDARLPAAYERQRGREAQGMLVQLAVDVAGVWPSVPSSEVATGRQASLGPGALRLMERPRGLRELRDKDSAARSAGAGDEVYGVMQENVNSMLLNADKLEDLRGKASAMGDNSKQFYSLARENRWTQQCREYKLRLLFGGVALLLLLVFLLPWLTAGGDDDKDQQ